MNPPFSAMAHVDRRMADAALRHVRSALARLADGGRLVAITGANFAPDNPAWTRCVCPSPGARPCGVLRGDRRHGLCQARHDHRDTPDRDRQGARRRSGAISGIAGIAPDVATLLDWIAAHVPPRRRSPLPAPTECRSAASHRSRHLARARRVRASGVAEPNSLNWPTRPWIGRRPKACASPRRFMKNTDCRRSVFPALRRIPPSWCSRWRWRRSRRPNPPIGRICRPHLSGGLLSDAQLESVIYTGEAHSDHLAGSW